MDEVKSEDVKKLHKRNIRIRAGHRSAVTKTCSSLEEFTSKVAYLRKEGDAAFVESCPMSIDDIDDAELFIGKLCEKLKVLDKLNGAIMDGMSDDEIESEVVEAEEYDVKIRSTLGKAKRSIEHAKVFVESVDLRSSLGKHVKTAQVDSAGATPSEESAVSSKLSESAAERSPFTEHESSTPLGTSGPGMQQPRLSTTSLNAGSMSRVRLPKLELPTFDGTISQWPGFWEAYDVAIHSNVDLALTDKFSYLRSMLRGQAAEAVAGLALTALNYEHAVEILRKRFGNTQLIINQHMEGLLSTASVGTDSDLTGLRRLYSTVEVHIRSLQALGVSKDAYGSLLSSVLMNRLPGEFRLIISRELSDSAWTIDSILSSSHQRRNTSTSAAEVPPLFCVLTAKSHRKGLRIRQDM